MGRLKVFKEKQLRVVITEHVIIWEWGGLLRSRTQKEQQAEWWWIDEEEIEQCRIQQGQQKVQDQPTRPNNQATTTNTMRKVREAEKTSDVLLAPVWTMSSKML